jgi:hypothetical protein
VLLVVACGGAFGQNIEVAVLGGGHIPVSPSVNVSTGWAVQGNLAGRLFGVPFVSLYAEVPVIATFGLDAGSACVTDAVCKFNSLWVTPGVKLKLGSELPISPYFVTGVGIVRFSTTQSSGSENSETHPVFDIGGGADMKIAPFVSLRGEIRDMYAGTPRLSIAAVTSRSHNLMVEGGLVFRF